MVLKFKTGTLPDLFGHKSMVQISSYKICYWFKALTLLIKGIHNFAELGTELSMHKCQMMQIGAYS
jgi:hypothetical protein